MTFTRYYSGIDLRGNGLRNVVLETKTGTALAGMLSWNSELGPVYHKAEGGPEIPLDPRIALGLDGTLTSFVQDLVDQKTLDSFDGYSDLATKAYVDGEIEDLNDRLTNVESGGIARAEMGVAGGVATLDPVTGKVPNSQLPSYVDDVLEAADFASLPEEGEGGKIYVTIDNGNVYRWTGSAYLRINDAVSTAETATKLETARSITLDGAVSGTANFDGTANITITTTSTLSTEESSPLILNNGVLDIALDLDTLDVDGDGKLTVVQKVTTGTFTFVADVSGLVDNETIDVTAEVAVAGVSAKFWNVRIEDASGNRVFFDIQQNANSIVVNGAGAASDEEFTLYWNA